MQADFFRRTQNYSFNMYFNMYVYIDKLLILVVFFFLKKVTAIRLGLNVLLSYWIFCY